MGNYTSIDLTLSIKEDKIALVDRLDQWIKQTPLYNPDITPDYWRDDNTFRTLSTGAEIPLKIFLDDPHSLFFSHRVLDFLFLGTPDINDYPVWQWDLHLRELEIHARFKNHWSQLDLFFNWLETVISSVKEGEFNTENDLEGPRYVKLIDNKLTVDRYSFTR